MQALCSLFMEEQSLPEKTELDMPVRFRNELCISKDMTLIPGQRIWRLSLGKLLIRLHVI